VATDVANTGWVGYAGVALSVVVHAITFVALGSVEPPTVLQRDDTVMLTVIDEVPEVKAPEPEPVPEPVAPDPEPVKPAPQPKVAAAEPKEPPPPAPENAPPPPPAEETIADFSGTTLVGEGEGGWVSAVGSGAPMDKPIGKAGAIVTGQNREGVQGGVVGGTGLKIVPLSDLTRKPQAPAQDVLNLALERSYPRTARQQGIEGVARIKIRVLANGKLQTLATVSETYPGFGEACRTSLRDLRFEPALDQKGQPVATEVPYICEFRVE